MVYKTIKIRPHGFKTCLKKAFRLCKEIIVFSVVLGPHTGRQSEIVLIVALFNDVSLKALKRPAAAR